MTAAVRPPGRWLFGPVPDLLLGCGLLYACIFVAFSLGGSGLAAHVSPALAPFLILLLSSPHYGATLLRVYEQRDDRQRYVVFALWATLGVGALFVLALHQPATAALFATVYLTWSPWHYTGQNYGLAVMFLRRRGVPVDALSKRLLYASFLLSYALTFLALHRAASGDRYTPAPQRATEIEFVSLGVPSGIVDVVGPIVFAAYLACLVAAAARLLRGSSVRDLLPSAALVATQALWFVLPFAAGQWRIRGVYPLDASGFVLWVIVGHAVQYLWVTAHYARLSPGWRGMGRWGAKVLASGLAIWSLPYVVFAPGALGLGPLSADAGLSLLIASAVNIHHFILDGAIWKLRSSKVAGVLIRDVAATEGGGPEPVAGGLARKAVWSVAAAGFAVAFFASAHERGYHRAFERGDLQSAADWASRSAWAGRDLALGRQMLGDAMREAGSLDEAEVQYLRAMELNPSHEAAYLSLGELAAHRGDYAVALAHYRDAIRLAPDAASPYHHLGRTLLASGELDEAVSAYRLAVSLDEDDPGLQRELGYALQLSGRGEDAVLVYRRALELAPRDIATHERLGAALRGLGRKGEADEHLLWARRLREETRPIPGT